MFYFISYTHAVWAIYMNAFLIHSACEIYWIVLKQHITRTIPAILASSYFIRDVENILLDSLSNTYMVWKGSCFNQKVFAKV